MKVSDIWGLVTLVHYAKPGTQGQVEAMKDVVKEVAAITDQGSHITSLELPKAYDLAVDILSEMRDGQNEKGSFTPKEKKQEIVKKGDVVDDYYKRLGVEKDATAEEIKSARNKLLQEFHPDVLTAQGKTPEEIELALEKAKDVNEAYYYLSKPERREEYDKLWDQKYSGSAEVQKNDRNAAPEEVEDTSDQQGSRYIDVNFKQQTKINPSSVKEAQALTAEFRQTVGNVGIFELDKVASGEMKFYSLYPESFTDSQVASALKMHADGVDSAQFAQEVLNNKVLTQAEREELLNIAYFQESLAASGVEGLPSAEVLALAGSNPTAAITGAAEWKTFVPGKFTFERRVAGKLAPVFQAGEKGIGSAITSETKDLAVKGIKLGARKLAKEGSKVAIKAGTNIALKAGANATIAGILEAIGISVGGPLGFLISTAIVLLLQIGLWLLGQIKNLLNPETIAYALMILGGIMIGAGASLAGGATLGTGIYNFFKGRGGGNFMRGLQGSFGGIGAMASGAIAIVFAAMAWPIIIAVIAIPLAVALILFIITTGAYVVPPFLTDSYAAVSNPYIDVKKTVKPIDGNKCGSGGLSSSFMKCQNSDLVLEVEYTVTITAKRGPLIDVNISDKCQIEREASSSSTQCPPVSNLQSGNIATGFPFSPPNNSVSPTEPYTFTYTRNFNPALSYYDSLASDTITVSATSTDGTSESMSSSASICFGNCPQSCPTIWPVESGYITQGPNGSWSHNVVEAIDISNGPGKTSGLPVYATHAGTVDLLNDPCEGNVIMIYSTCAGVEFSSRYSHLGTRGVSDGSTVVKGQQIGTIDNTGSLSCKGTAHLHYEFRDGQGKSSRAFKMEPPNIPEPILPSRSCCNNCGPTCTTTIP